MNEIRMHKKKQEHKMKKTGQNYQTQKNKHEKNVNRDVANEDRVNKEEANADIAYEDWRNINGKYE